MGQNKHLAYYNMLCFLSPARQICRGKGITNISRLSSRTVLHVQLCSVQSRGDINGKHLSMYQWDAYLTLTVHAKKPRLSWESRYTISSGAKALCNYLIVPARLFSFNAPKPSLSKPIIELSSNPLSSPMLWCWVILLMIATRQQV